jgi:hypothetical protein
MFSVKKNTYLEKNSIIRQDYKYPKCLKQISKYSIKFATPDFFIENLQLLNNHRNVLFFYNFPNLNIIDDYGLLFIFKIYSLYEKKKYNIVEIPYFNKMIYIFNNNINQEEIYRHIVIQSCRSNNQYINITTEERNISDSILLYENLDYDKNKDKLLYYYLRLIIMRSQDYNIKKSKYLDKYKIKIDFSNIKKYYRNLDKFLKKYWDELLKENPHYEADMKKQFDINYKSLMEKIDHFMKSPEYKSYRRKIHIKPFKFPFKKFFGSEKPLQYKMFANLIDEFKKTDDYRLA